MASKGPARPPADPKAFDEAVTWFRERLLMTDAEFAATEEASHATAFTVAGVAQLDLVTQVWEAADRSVAHGETLASFQKAVGDKLAAAWGKEMPWRVETILRTNVQSAYSQGRHVQMTHPAILRTRPYWKFSNAMDQRTSNICRALDGTVRKNDDPWWDTHTPPCHFNCRSEKITLSKREAEREGVTEKAPEAEADEGFGKAPKPGATWKPDLSQYPPQLVGVYHEPTRPEPVKVAPAEAPPPVAAPPPAPPAAPPPGDRGSGGGVPRPRPPWFTGDDPRPPGELGGHLDQLKPHELGTMERMRLRGNSFWALDRHAWKKLRLSKAPRHGEGWMGSGVSAEDVPRDLAHLVEAKTLDAGRYKAGMIVSRVRDALLGGGQAPNVIIDASKTDLTEKQARAEVELLRGIGSVKGLGPLWHLHVEGATFYVQDSDF